MRETYEVGPGKTVTITVHVDDAPSTLQGLGSRLYTAEEVGDLQASEAELVAAPLRREVAELSRKLDRVYADLDRSMEATEKAKRDAETFKDQAYRENDKAAELRSHVKTLEKTLAESRELVDFKTRVADEIERDKDKLFATVRDQRQSLAARDRLLEAATRRIDAAREFLSRSPVAEARENIVTSKGAVLADAIGNALRVLDRA